MNGGGMDRFLEEHPYVDFSSPNVRAKAEELFSGVNSPVEKIVLSKKRRSHMNSSVTRSRTALISTLQW
ncbi:hypothetical protein [Methanolacinia petrolearia]|uniref:hypothetical protein n=1 Tax=Methanolacinia petrolearia TaxID=54120 RepID=UPI001CDB3B21|nr:hypothetical protein [Methanolacinia petrolearia]